jgi:hypothetical protein
MKRHGGDKTWSLGRDRSVWSGRTRPQCSVDGIIPVVRRLKRTVEMREDDRALGRSTASDGGKGSDRNDGSARNGMPL